MTQEPSEVDTVVCLGGGTPERVQRSIELVKQGFARDNKLLLLGENDTNILYIEKHEPTLDYIPIEKPKNTAQEVLLIKNYMREHNYKSVIIVTDSPHSRRVNILADFQTIEGDNLFSYIFVSSGVKWWGERKTGRYPKAQKFIISELVKIIYTYFYYGALLPLGIEWSDAEYKALKQKFMDGIREVEIAIEKVM